MITSRHSAVIKQLHEYQLAAREFGMDDGVTFYQSIIKQLNQGNKKIWRQVGDVKDIESESMNNRYNAVIEFKARWEERVKSQNERN